MHVLCGVSGGADSVALLRMLCERRNLGELTLTAAHFEHGIRGDASLADADFVRELCARLNVPLIEGSADVPALARSRGQGTEQAAREARHAFLRDAKVRSGADAIALAHHRGDQAETVLMHIARGAGLCGAVGMRERDGDIWRPLIHMSKADILAYLRGLGQDHREDSTNLDVDNPRNALRNIVLPALGTVYPGAEPALCRFAEIARAEDEVVRGLADDFWAGCAEQLPMGWRIEVKEDAHLAVLRRVLVRAVENLRASNSRGSGSSVGFDTIERLAALYRAPKGRLSVSGGILAERVGMYLYLIDEFIAPPGPVPIEDGAALPGIGRIRMERCEPIGRDLGPWSQILDAAALERAVLRCRMPGDRFQMLGSAGGRLLSDVMVDRRIDRPLRDFWPLVAAQGDVLWAPGIGVSERAKIGPGTARAVCATFDRAIDNGARYADNENVNIYSGIKHR